MQEDKWGEDWRERKKQSPENFELFLFLLTEPRGLPLRFPVPAEAESERGAAGNAPPEWPTGTAEPPWGGVVFKLKAMPPSGPYFLGLPLFLLSDSAELPTMPWGWAWPRPKPGGTLTGEESPPLMLMVGAAKTAAPSAAA